MNWVLYGANGYTGRMIAQEAKLQRWNPILAGRNEREVRALASELGFRALIFDCETDAIIEALKNEKISAVLHCAGPYSATSRPMLDACVRLGAHYLDITGEIPVFERVLKKSMVFRDAGIVAIPGVGFDIVPSDCLAATLKRALPGATELRMGLKITGGTSPGTTKTMIEGLHAGGVVRKNGQLARIPAAAKTRKLRFWEGLDEDFCVLFPWGDVSSAYYSTGIGDIEIFVASSPGYARLMKLSRYLAPLLMLRSTQKLLKCAAEISIAGPSSTLLENGPYYLWGAVRDPAGNQLEMRLKTPNGYALTVDSALSALERVLAGKVPPGSWTPSQAFGPDFVNELRGVEWRV